MKAPTHPLEPRPLAAEEDRGYVTPCWIWQSWKGGHGYGGITIDGRQMLAHRWSYELLVGPIPEGLTIDHLCFERLCVNPHHLEPVTVSENSKRQARAGRGDFGRTQLAKTMCPHGHPYSEDNTFRRRGKRECRMCMRERTRRARSSRAH